MASHCFISGRRITSNGFTKAFDLNGNYAMYRTKSGEYDYILMGVTEWSLPGADELFKGENHKSTKKTGARPILWLPRADGYKHGKTIYMDKYCMAQKNPELYKDVIERLKEYEVPLNVNCN